MLQFDVHSQCCFLTNTQPSSTGAAPRNQFKKAFLLGDFKERKPLPYGRREGQRWLIFWLSANSLGAKH